MKNHKIFCLSAVATIFVLVVGCSTSDPESLTRGCGDSICSHDECVATCPEDCTSAPQCGDGLCEAEEQPMNCPEDCPAYGCGNGVCEPSETDGSCPEDCSERQCGNGICEYSEKSSECIDDCDATRKLDILFIVDSSYSMDNEREALQAAFPSLYDSIKSQGGIAPDLHVGIVTTDMGTGSHTSIPLCEELGGDGGVMGMYKGNDVGEACLGPGQRFMIDTAPEGCVVDRYVDGTCQPSSCDDSNCVHEPGSSLVLDSGNCPRCRNYTAPNHDAFTCLASIGLTIGCGFEQPLEAMNAALDPSRTPENAGFFRQDALLAIVFVTDEDDCSASDPDTIFDPDQSLNNISSELGFLHSFRCFEFGVTCDINGRVLGHRTDCVPRDDPGALLYPIDHYTSFIDGLKDPGQVVVMALAGPFDGTVEVVLNTQGQPELRPSCVDQHGQGATPAIRLRAFAAHYNDPAALEEAFVSVCEVSFDGAVASTGSKIQKKLTY